MCECFDFTCPRHAPRVRCDLLHALVIRRKEAPRLYRVCQPCAFNLMATGAFEYPPQTMTVAEFGPLPSKES